MRPDQTEGIDAARREPLRICLACPENSPSPEVTLMGVMEEAVHEFANYRGADTAMIARAVNWLADKYGTPGADGAGE